MLIKGLNQLQNQTNTRTISQLKTDVFNRLNLIYQEISLVDYKRLFIAFLLVGRWVYINSNIPQLSYKPHLLGILNHNQVLYHILGNLIFMIPTVILFFYPFRKFEKVLFHKLKKGFVTDLIVLIFIQFVLAITATGLFVKSGIDTETNANLLDPLPFAITMYDLVISLIAEQIFFFMSIFFAIVTLNKLVKKDSILIMLLSMIFAGLIFGIAHLSAYNNNVFQCLILIGLPFTLIQTVGFVLTRNMIFCYLIHLLFDVIIYFLSLI